MHPTLSGAAAQHEARLAQAIVEALYAPADPAHPYDKPGHRYERAIRDAILEGSAWAYDGGRNDPEQIVHALRIALRHIPARGVNAPGRNAGPRVDGVPVGTPDGSHPARTARRGRAARGPRGRAKLGRRHTKGPGDPEDLGGGEGEAEKGRVQRTLTVDRLPT